jgi:branched-chain amino acid transport system substrate-binding protein
MAMPWPVDGHAESVSIAIAGPMIGTSSTVGAQYRVGVEAAISSLPQGRLLGAEVKVRTFDDSCKAVIAEAVAHKIASERHPVVIGHSCSSASIAAAPIYADAGILQITPASTNPRVTEMGITSLFRMIGRDDRQGKIAAERLATEHGGQRIGILRFPGAYSFGLTDHAIAELAGRGIQPSIVIEAAPSASSYIRQIEELTRAGVDVVYLVGGGLDSAVFLRQWGQLGATFSIISADTLVSRIFIETAGAFGENVPFTFPPDATKRSAAAVATERIRSQGNDPAGYTLLAYAAAEVWFEGVRRAGSFDTSRVAAAIRERPVTTVLGEVSFDAKGDIHTEYQPFDWFVWRNGKRVRLE